MVHLPCGRMSHPTLDIPIPVPVEDIVTNLFVPTCTIYIFLKASGGVFTLLGFVFFQLTSFI